MYNNMSADNTFLYEGKRSVESFSRCEKIITSVKIRSPTKAIGMQHILRILNPEAAELINPNKKRRSSPTKKTFVGFLLYKIPNFIYRQTRRQIFKKNSRNYIFSFDIFIFSLLFFAKLINER